MDAVFSFYVRIDINRTLNTFAHQLDDHGCETIDDVLSEVWSMLDRLTRLRLLADLIQEPIKSELLVVAQGAREPIKLVPMLAKKAARDNDSYEALKALEDAYHRCRELWYIPVKHLATKLLLEANKFWSQEMPTDERTDAVLGMSSDAWLALTAEELGAWIEEHHSKGQNASTDDGVVLELHDTEFLTAAVSQKALRGVYVSSNEIWDAAGYRGEKLPRGITKRLKKAGLIKTNKKGVTVTDSGERYIEST